MDLILGMFLGLVFGRGSERKHLASLAAREQSQLGQILVDNRKRVSAPESVAEATLVIGQTVVASDYAKTFFARWRSFFGGELRSLQTLLDRGRRESLLRMKQQAQAMGATEVWNVRFDTSNISAMSGKQGLAQVEVIAWGTAIRRRDTPADATG